MSITNPDNPDGGCSVQTTVSLAIFNGTAANALDDIKRCDDDDDGFFAFDTSTIEFDITSGQTDVSVLYFDGDGEALSSPLPNPFTTNSQTITVQVEQIANPICRSEITFDFVVSQQPTAFEIAHDFSCDTSSDGIGEVFMLSSYDAQILNAQSSSNFEIFYFDNNEDAVTNTGPLASEYLVNTQSQSIYARIQNRDNPDCFDITDFEIGAIKIPIAYVPEKLSVCDDTSNDGFEVFNLEEQKAVILNGQSDAAFRVAFFKTQEEAFDNGNVIPLNYTNTSNPQTIYARIENNLLPACFDITSFEIEVNPIPDIDLQDVLGLCQGESLEIEAPIGNYYYDWSTGETTSSISVDESGDYTVSVTNTAANGGCSVTKTIQVVESTVATILDIEITDWSQNDNTITIIIEGSGDYEYSIDGILYQDNNIFTGLTIDEYSVFVRDKNGCGINSEDIYLLYYPKYFTPNNDGYNDVWQLYSAEKELGNKLFIYDRYGKLLKQLGPNENGWDGNLNGQKLPTNDYWFVLERQNGKQYSGHFTLKN